MAITVPYTWTPARIQQAWADPTPAGLWYIDYVDPSYVAGVTIVYRALPYWGALDFGYTKDRKLLILMAGPHDNGLSAVLRVYRFDGDPTAPTSAGYAEIEASGVSGAAMIVRGSSQVDVFYTLGGVLKHSLSEDGGETFSAGATVSLTSSGGTAFVPSQAAYVGGSSTIFVSAHARGGFVAAEKLAGGAVALIVAGRLSGGFADDNFIVKGDWDGSAWDFGSIARIDSSPTTGVVSGFQALRGGDCLLLGWGKQVCALQRTGAFTLKNSISGVGTGAGGFDEATNQYMFWSSLSGTSVDGSGRYGNLRPESRRYVASSASWSFGGTASVSLKEWAQNVPLTTSPSFQTTLKSPCGKARLNRDRRWEVLYMGRDELPTLTRYSVIPANCAGLATV